MLKKIISAMLALTLALSLAGVVCASGGPEQGIERVQILEEAVPAGAVPMAQASGNYFIPYDWTYGQSVVVGQSMFLRVAVNDVGLSPAATRWCSSTRGHMNPLARRMSR